MRLMINVKMPQLRGVLKELRNSCPDMDMVISIKEEKCEEKSLGYQRLTREQLERYKGEETKEEEKYPMR